MADDNIGDSSVLSFTYCTMLFVILIGLPILSGKGDLLSCFLANDTREIRLGET